MDRPSVIWVLAQIAVASLGLFALSPQTRALAGQWFCSCDGYLQAVVVAGVLSVALSLVRAAPQWLFRAAQVTQALLSGYLMTEAAYALAGGSLKLPAAWAASIPAVQNLNELALMRLFQVVALAVMAVMVSPLLSTRVHRSFGDPDQAATSASLPRSWSRLSLQIVGLLVAAAAARHLAFRDPAGPAVDLAVLAAIVAGATVNSCLEELIFRGVILEALSGPAGPRLANHLTAFAFAFLHGGPPLLLAEPGLFLTTFGLYYFLSLLFGWSVHDTGGIGVACGLHSAVAATIRGSVYLAQGVTLP
ncbi:MAG: CPBP family intramembrane metalloprotease [Candidatus Riflebacteria bacterium]|nr:CPBP family intramembrane metalloprotease [Candidatus Riflebacteria bacterium]